MAFFKKRVPAASKIDAPTKEKDRAAVDRGLRAIYVDAKGHVPKLDRFERTRSWRMAWFFAAGGALCLLLTVLAWSGFWVFGGGAAMHSSAFEVVVQGSTDVSLGEEQTYELVWRNAEPQLLTDVEIRLNIPTDFTVTAFEPAPTDAGLRIWKLGLVQPQASGRIRVKGFFVGSLGEQTALQVLSTYRANRTETVSEQTSLQTIHYTGTVLAGNLLFPERVLAGEPTQIKYAIANLGKQPLDQLVAKLTFPPGFIPGTMATGTQLDLARRTVLFPIGSLAAGSFYTATLPGVFVSGGSGEATFQAETGRMSVENALLVAARSEARLVIAPGDLTVRLIVNGVDEARTLEPGEPMRATIAYENVSTQVVKDVAITLQLESVVNGRSATGTSLVNWKEFDDPKQGTSTTKSRVQTIRYDKTRIPLLAELAPGARGTIDVGWLTLPVASGTRDALIRVAAQTQVSVTGERAPRLIRSQPVTVTYRTDADVVVEPRYFSEEGAPLGSGPLPPTVGKTTTYRIYWTVQKSLHEVRDLTIRAALPTIAAWTGKMEGATGAFVYDEKTRIVTWNVGRVPENTRELEGWFEVALTPQAIDVGRFASLLGETSFQGMDVRLNETIRRTKPGLSTDLSMDEGAKGKGVVR